MDTTIPSNLQPFLSFPVSILSTSCKAWLSCHLNPEKASLSASQYLQDWRGMAEVLGFSVLHIDNFHRSKDPLAEVLKSLPAHRSCTTMQDLLTALLLCGRHDVVDDPLLERFLEKNLTPHSSSSSSSSPSFPSSSLPLVACMEQDSQVDSQCDPLPSLTVWEKDTGQQEYFDAYVCFAESDAAFVDVMREVLEEHYHLKLCIPERDLLPGLFKQESIARLIKERCTKMLAILSPGYLQSDECRFLTNLASSLEPGVRGRKLVPVVVAECAVPNILLPLSMIKFTRSGALQWAWTRLAKSLQSTAATSPQGAARTLQNGHKSRFSSLPALCYFKPTLTTNALSFGDDNSHNSSNPFQPALKQLMDGSRLACLNSNNSNNFSNFKAASAAHVSQSDSVLHTQLQTLPDFHPSSSFEARKTCNIFNANTSQQLHSTSPQQNIHPQQLQLHFTSHQHNQCHSLHDNKSGCLGSTQEAKAEVRFGSDPVTTKKKTTLFNFFKR